MLFQSKLHLRKGCYTSWSSLPPPDLTYQTMPVLSAGQRRRPHRQGVCWVGTVCSFCSFWGHRDISPPPFRGFGCYWTYRTRRTQHVPE